MIKYKAGFIGVGNMGGALLTAAAKSAAHGSLAICDQNKERTAALSEEYGCAVLGAQELTEESSFVFLGAKPQGFASLLSPLKDAIAKNKDITLVTMAAGLSIDAVRKMAGGDYPVIRIMPNTAVGVGEGMILYATSENLSEEKLCDFLSLMRSAGSFDRIPEALIDAGSALSGCGPAFVYMFIEALSDGGVACGLPRDKAVFYAAQTVLGAAKNLLVSKKHCGELKDAVCSPGGTTIEGVRTLESKGLRAAAAEAVVSAYKRTLELKK